MLFALYEFVNIRVFVSKLPKFVNDAAESLQNLKSYRYFDFFLISGRYFDSALLLKGFTLLYAFRKTNIEIRAGQKCEKVTLDLGELLIVSNAYLLKILNKKSSFLNISVAGYFLTFTKSSDDKEEVYRSECHPISDNKKHLLDLFTEFQQSYKKEGSISKFRTSALLKLAIADILDLADGHRQKYFEKGKSRESYNKLAVYLRENVHLSFDSNQVSESLGFSVQYLNSLAHDFRNMSLKELVNFYRLEMSRKVLIESDSPVAELASACGFKSSAYFIKLFKQAYNITPLQLRKKLRHRDSQFLKEFHKVVSFQEIPPVKQIPEIEIDLSETVTIVIINSSLRTIAISWLNPEEPEVEMYRLNPGQRIHLGTVYKECWIARETSGELIAYYSVPNTNCQIII